MAKEFELIDKALLQSVKTVEEVFEPYKSLFPKQERLAEYREIAKQSPNPQIRGLQEE